MVETTRELVLKARMIICGGCLIRYIVLLFRLRLRLSDVSASQNLDDNRGTKRIHALGYSDEVIYRAMPGACQSPDDDQRRQNDQNDMTSH